MLALMVAAAVVLVPTVNVALLGIFPPPMPQFEPHLCPPGEPDCKPPPRGHGEGPPPRARMLFNGAALQGFHLGGSEREGAPPGVDRAQYAADFGALRSHFLWINLASLSLVLLASVLLIGLMLRWPIRGLLTAIEDIEHGSVPAAGGLMAPSELRQIGQALHRLAKQLRSATQERELMLAGMSHDLRSPLARIQAAIELRARPEEDWQPVLRDVREIDHIIGQCIDFVRDGQDEAPTSVVPDRLVLDLLRGDADREVQLDLGAPEAVPLRRQSVLRALRNLLDNAQVHGAPPVTIRTRHEAGMVSFSVEDGGSGIDATHWQRLRQPFAQGARARHPGGAGLGLAIVQRVAERHGGSFELAERDGASGTCLVLRLPV